MDIFIDFPLKEIVKLCNVATALVLFFFFFYFSSNSKFYKQISGQSATNSFKEVHRRVGLTYIHYWYCI